MAPKVSFIIPAYNIEDYIGKCLDSILNQTWQDFEIIVVNDGSKDKTGEVLDSYATKDNRIKILHKENEGVSAARNDGIKMASGEYILFWDGDDFAEKETCEELLQTMEENDVDTVVYGYYRYKDGAVFETNYPLFDKEIYEGEEILDKMVPQFIGLSYDKINDWLRGKENSLYVENPARWRIMVSRKIIVDNNLVFDTRLKVGEDTCFISEYLSCAKRCFVKQKCYYYLVTRESSTIFVYERKVMQKVQGKVNLLDGRTDLTNRIKKRTGKDISDTWGGIAMMSAVQIGFMMAGKNPDHSFKERYAAYKNYVTDERVKQIVKKYVPTKEGGVKKLPFLFLKKEWYGLLFFAICCLKMVNYEFSRE